MKNFIRLLLLFSIATATAAKTPVNGNVYAGFTMDDNVTRAEMDRDIESDNVLNVGVSGSVRFPFNEISYFALKGELDLYHYMDFSKLSNNRIGIHGSYHLRPEKGYTALQYFARIAYIERMYDSDQRNGNATELELGLSKKFTDQLSLRFGYIKEDIDSDESKGVFDADNNRFYLDLGLKLNDRNQLYGTLGLTDGDVVSTTIPNRAIIDASRPFIVRDDAFTDLTPARFAYRLNADTTTLRIGNVFSISSEQVVDASIFYYKSEAAFDNNYDGLILNAEYRLRF